MVHHAALQRVAALALIFLISSEAWAAGKKLVPAQQWPQWRGPLGTGVAPKGAPPVSPHSHGAHHNAEPSRKIEFVVLAVDRTSGEIVWRRTVCTARPHESIHTSGSWASSSAVTDGRHVYASFGSNGLYCLDMNGELKWKKDLGDMRIKHGHGEGSSPALAGKTLVVNWDHEDG